MENLEKASDATVCLQTVFLVSCYEEVARAGRRTDKILWTMTLSVTGKVADPRKSNQSAEMTDMPIKSNVFVGHKTDIQDDIS
jgi:hypothetical protein